jgi:hypothetical protein
MTDRQIRRNAEIVADGLASAWRNAYVIACSVRIEERGGDRRSNANSRLIGGKVSGEEFARLIKAAANGKVYGMGPHGVRAALRKWDKVAPEYGLPTSNTLTPADADHDVDYPNRSWFEEDGNGESEKSKIADIANNPKAVVEAVRQSPNLAEAIVADNEADERINIAKINKELTSAGHPPLQPYQEVPDPTPRWRRITLNIAGDIRAVLTEIGNLRDDGQYSLANQALTELREVLIDGVARTETVPDTPEGIER